MVIHYLALRTFPSTVIILLAVMNCISGQAWFKYGDNVSDFTFERLMKNFYSQTDNIVLSPLSFYIAYTWLLAGARGKTWYDLAHELNLAPATDKKFEPSSAETITSAFARLSRDYSEKSSMVSSNLLAVSDKIKTIKQEFVDVTIQFRAHIAKEKFDKPAEAQKNINSWVANKTKKMIDKILDDPPDKDSKMILVNAVYFKGIWNESFHPNDTQKLIFHNADGSESKIDFMTKKSTLKHSLLLRYEKDVTGGFEYIELPYKDSMSMFIILPPQHMAFKKMDYNFRSMNRLKKLARSKPVKVDYLAIPKFKITKSYDMHEFINATLARSNDADFSGISDEKFKVDKSFHKTAVEINEEGTVAAAATSISMVPMMSSLDGNSFVADRPFIFVIIDNSIHMISFAGLITKL